MAYIIVTPGVYLQLIAYTERLYCIMRAIAKCSWSSSILPCLSDVHGIDYSLHGCWGWVQVKKQKHSSLPCTCRKDALHFPPFQDMPGISRGIGNSYFVDSLRSLMRGSSSKNGNLFRWSTVWLLGWCLEQNVDHRVTHIMTCSWHFSTRGSGAAAAALSNLSSLEADIHR